MGESGGTSVKKRWYVGLCVFGAHNRENDDYIGSEEVAWAAMENGGSTTTTTMPMLKGSSRELRPGQTAHNMWSSSLRKKSELSNSMVKVQRGLLGQALANVQEAVLVTKLSVLFPAIPLAITASATIFGGSVIPSWIYVAVTPLI